MPLRVTEEMVERGLKAFRKGPPGVLRSLEQRDSYPGEYSGDPEAYVQVPTTGADTKHAIRDVLEAAMVVLR